MSKIWLVTGSSRGLGRHIVTTALAAGDSVVATCRDPHQLADLVARHGERIRVTALDVTDAAAARAAVQLAVDTYGRLDVLVNNAGYGHIAAFEQVDDAAFRAQIDTNFYGVVNVTRAALPVMRRQRSGHILQVSSLGGRIGNAGLSAYQAAKWAVGGLTEVLRQELDPIGIKITTLEPGGIRTDWGQMAASQMPDVLPEYAASVGALAALIGPYIGHENSDPARIAAIVLALTRHANPPVHLLLGSDAMHYCAAADAERSASAATWSAVSASADFGATDMAPLPL